LLEANGVMLDLIVSEPDPFVENFIKSIDKKQLLTYDFICCISGDGSTNEILNGYY